MKGKDLYILPVYTYKLEVYIVDGITENEMRIVLTLFKDTQAHYNANSISKTVQMTPMGALKILKRLEKKGILKGAPLGKATYYTINWDDGYAKEYVLFLLKKEAEESPARVRRWAEELKKLYGQTRIIILFGSLLTSDHYNDVDILMILDKDQHSIVRVMVEAIQKKTAKRLHTVMQTMGDYKRNMNTPTMQEIQKGIIIHGCEQQYQVIRNGRIREKSRLVP